MMTRNDDNDGLLTTHFKQKRVNTLTNCTSMKDSCAQLSNLLAYFDLFILSLVEIYDLKL